MEWIKKIETEAGILGIGELNKPLEEFLFGFQSTDSERETFDKLILEKRKKEFLGVRLIAEELLHEKSEIIYDSAGRPALKNSLLNISISHSNELVAILVSEKKVGVDVENINRTIEKVAKRFLSQKELEYTKRQKDAQTTMILFWSTKEAVYKCSGLNGILFNHDIIIHTGEIGENEPFYTELIKDGIKHIYQCRSFFFKNNVVVYSVEEESKMTNE
jgi:4'-phosphopantetheinyl transferase